jgi:hypothetical protein
MQGIKNLKVLLRTLSLKNHKNKCLVMAVFIHVEQWQCQPYVKNYTYFCVCLSRISDSLVFIWAFVHHVLHKSSIKFCKPALLPFLGPNPPDEILRKSYSSARTASVAESRSVYTSRGPAHRYAPEKGSRASLRNVVILLNNRRWTKSKKGKILLPIII